MHTYTPPRAVLAALVLAGAALLGTPRTAQGTAPAAPAPARVEWAILTSNRPYPVLVLDGAPLGPIEQGVCAVYDPAPDTLTLYSGQPVPPGAWCWPFLKAIRLLAPGKAATALQVDLSAPFFVGVPHDSLPVLVNADGTLTLTLPPQVKDGAP